MSGKPSPESAMKWIIFENAKLVLEAAAVFGTMLLFMLYPSVRKTWRTASLRMIVVAVGFLFALEALAQVSTRNQYTYPQKHEPFPFTRWAMFAGFAGSMESGVIYDWRGVSATGAGVVVNPALLYLTPNAVILFTKTHSLGDQLTAAGPPPGPGITKALDAFAQGLLSRYNARHPEAPVSKIELWKRTLPLQKNAQVPAPFATPGSMLVYTFTPPHP
jgi:hypothetical protein